MDTIEGLLALLAVALFGIMAIVVKAGEQREGREAAMNVPFMVSNEGQRRCSKCGMGNGWTMRDCISCGTPIGG